VNRQYGLGNSKYVVILDPLPTGHVTRSMRRELLAFNMGKSSLSGRNLVSDIFDKIHFFAQMDS